MISKNTKKNYETILLQTKFMLQNVGVSMRRVCYEQGNPVQFVQAFLKETIVNLYLYMYCNWSHCVVSKVYKYDTKYDQC